MLNNTHNGKSEYLAIMKDPLQSEYLAINSLTYIKEYINKVVYPIYIVLVGKYKYKGKDIDNLFYILS